MFNDVINITYIILIYIFNYYSRKRQLKLKNLLNQMKYPNLLKKMKMIQKKRAN